MKTTEAVIWAGGTQASLAKALYKCSQAAVAQWGEFPPSLRQLELERITKGRLKAEPECDRYRVGKARA